MIAYIRKVQRAFIKQHGFPENPEKPGCVLGDVPPGVYPTEIDGKTDYVKIANGCIDCCNFLAPDAGAALREQQFARVLAVLENHGHGGSNVPLSSLARMVLEAAR